MPFSEDGSLKGTSIEQYYKEVIPVFSKTGYEVNVGPNLERWTRDAGFVDVQVHKFLVPIGSWAKDKHYVCVPFCLHLVMYCALFCAPDTMNIIEKNRYLGSFAV